MKNFHHPLPEQTCSLLRAEAERIHQAITTYAREMAGTNLDLDQVLESAGIEHLMKTGKDPK